MSEQKVSPWRLCGAEAVCRESRNTMMAPQADTSYRDRVHGASIAILPSLMERRHEPGYSDDGACHESVRLAITQIDAIDKALAEREDRDV